MRLVAKAVFLAIAMLFGLSLNIAHADWENTRYGMTIEEVQKLYPTAKQISPLEDARTQTLLTDYRVSGLQFKLEFVFMRRQLVQARLTLQQTERCGEILSDIEKKYGPATSTESPPQVVRKSWLMPNENIFWVWANTVQIKACVVSYNAARSTS